jgi:outer membrane protein OmpA-like peptidoglycan-associated protein/opacity protein-like surface antigen
MRQIFYRTGKAILLLSVFTVWASASHARIVKQARSNVSLGIEGGMAVPQSPSDFSSEFDSGQAYGLRIRCGLSERWAAAARFHNETYKGKDLLRDKITIQPVTVEAHRLFAPDSLTHPYVMFGLGLSRNVRNNGPVGERATKAAFSLGAGAEINLTDLTSLTAEAGCRYVGGASPKGKAVQTASLSVLLNFYIPDEWVPRKLKTPLDLTEKPTAVVISTNPAVDPEKKLAQEELDKVQQDIRDRKIQPIHFETGQSVLLQTSFETLDIVGTILRRYPQFKIRIDGHTDEVGSEEDNMILSQARAEVVRAYLIQNFGLAADKLFTAAYGKMKPIADNNTEEGRFLNRRVEFSIIP